MSVVAQEKNWEGYYSLGDEEGYLFQESDGGYYFFHCFKGEGFYYRSDESDYFHAGESLYEKERGLETLDGDLQRLALDDDYGGEVGEGLSGGGRVGDVSDVGCDHKVANKVAEDLRCDFDKLGLHGDYHKLGLNGDLDKLVLRFHKQLQVLKEQATEGTRTLVEAEVAGEVLEMDMHRAHSELEDPKSC